MIGRVQHRAGYPCPAGRRGGPGQRRTVAERLCQADERAFVSQVQTLGIAAIGEQVSGQRDQVMALAGAIHGAHDINRIGRQFLRRHLRIGEAMDKTAVRAIFQQAADQIGEQRFMRADRGVDAARAVQLRRADHLFI